MMRHVQILKAFGPAVGVIVVFVIPALVVSIFNGAIPQPLQFQLFFSALPVGLIVGAFWTKWQIGIVTLVACWLVAGEWTAYHLGHFDDLLFSDLNRLGQDIGSIYFALTGIVTLITLTHFLILMRKSNADVQPERREITRNI